MDSGSGMPLQEDTNNSRSKLSQVKTASLYENIIDVNAFGRSLNDAVSQFKETRTDFIFRGFWLWQPAFETPEDISSEVLKLAETKNLGSAQISGVPRTKVRGLPPALKKSLFILGLKPGDFLNGIKLIKERGYFYKQLADSIAVIKKNSRYNILRRYSRSKG